MDMFALMRPAPIRRECEPHGSVLQGEAQELLSLPGKIRALPLAEIELHPHDDGLWMWSTSYHLEDMSGGSYKVGPKWGKFAPTRSDALFYAAEELIEKMGKKSCVSARRVEAWARDLQ
ncbi:hypothetical protein [Falsirhodobacter sp. 1013]|uniref:hypothetical protein n=1 Tax=Falsirhodobacter sp. 1013 TaxID=3417566 RepID=UPI003EC0340D